MKSSPPECRARRRPKVSNAHSLIRAETRQNLTHDWQVDDNGSDELGFDPCRSRFDRRLETSNRCVLRRLTGLYMFIFETA